MFDKLIGQEKVKKRLNFYSRLHKRRYPLPTIMFNAAKGSGKTEFARQFHNTIKRDDDHKFFEINCGTIRNAEDFFEQVYIPSIAGKNRTVLFDECHALPKDLTDVFLSAFNVEGHEKKQVTFGMNIVTFDFLKQVYLFATTELHKIFPPLKDRMTTIDFKPYTQSELGDIIKLNTKDIKYDSDVIERIVSCLRGNARSAVDMARQIREYCIVENHNAVDVMVWRNIMSEHDILPFGLNNTEVQILRALKKRGACSLQMLSAITGMSRQAIQLEAENNLLRKGFMEIDGKRKITNTGTKILEQIK